MKKIGICGHFGFGHECLNGQTIKTKIVTKALKEKYGKENISLVDSYNAKKRLIGILFGLCKLLFTCKNIIIFPAHNGLRVFAPFLAILNKVFKRNLIYIVIGGWLPKFLKERAYLKKSLLNFDYIYVETKTMKINLEEQGFKNIHILPNCKELTILNNDEIIYQNKTPLKICTFSRVIKEKGIEDIVNVVKNINEDYCRVIYKLDIYGPIGEDQQEWFEMLRKDFPNYINYCGTVSAKNSVDIVKNYFILVFPTKFFTEGIPGTIIDAYAAGVPVLSSKWESFNDMIEDGKTGIGYKFNDLQELKEKLIWCYNHCDSVNGMKIYCLEEAKKYSLNAIKIVFV